MKIVREREFDCVECGQHVIQFGADLDRPALCANCMTLPGWFNEPELRRILDPERGDPG